MPLTFEIFYEDEVSFETEEDEATATKQIIEQIRSLYRHKIYPNVGWEIWTNDFDEFMITRIIYANRLFQFYLA